MKSILAAFLMLLTGAGPAAASLASCTASATPVNFGAYDPLALGDTPSTGSVTVTCNLVLGLSLLVGYTIKLSAGSGSFAARTLRSGGNAIQYNLYTNAGYGTVWGDGGAGTGQVSDGYLLGLANATRNYPVFGRIPARQMVGAGAYADSIVVTISY